MKKYFKYLIFILVVFIMTNVNVYALTCEYTNGSMTASFDIESNGSAARAKVKGNMVSSNNINIDEGEPIMNWDKSYEPNFLMSPAVSFTGENYYKEEGKCPPYAILYDRIGSLNLVVSDKNNLERFISYGEGRQGYSIMCLEGVNCNNLVPRSCKDYYSENDCLTSPLFACVWNVNEYSDSGYCNTDNLLYVTCGDARDIPYQVPRLISYLVNLLKIATPIILIVISIITLVKAVAASREDEIKKAQNSLIRKMIAAALVFFVISIVQFVILKVADSSETDNISNCLSCFLNNSCGENTYYKTNVAGTYVCTKAKTGQSISCGEGFDDSNVVDTKFYSGAKADSCGGYGYFSNGYQPRAITINGACYELKNTGNKILKSSESKKGIVLGEQSIWEANGQCYYWEGTKNSYLPVVCDAEVVTPYYIGKKAFIANGVGYFDNGYQPNAVMIEENYKIKGTYYLYSTKFVYITEFKRIDGQTEKVVQPVLEAKIESAGLTERSSYLYYWDESLFKYVQLPQDWVGTLYYQGEIPLETKYCSVYGYFDNGYQPKYVRDSNKYGSACSQLIDIGKKYSFETTDLLGNTKVVKQTLWKANNKCYYWEGREFKYKEIDCSLGE